jgi:hypothetical protein
MSRCAIDREPETSPIFRSAAHQHTPTSRCYFTQAGSLYVVGFRSEADMPRVSGACRSDDNDPNRTLAAKFSVTPQHASHSTMWYLSQGLLSTIGRASMVADRKCNWPARHTR